MTRVRKRGETVRSYILESIENNRADVVTATMKEFGISRQAVYQHMRHLVNQGGLVHTRYGAYELRPQEEWKETISIAENPHEDVVWRNLIAPRIGRLPDNALSIWGYGFTEMFNNVVDHSESKTVTLIVSKTARRTEIVIWDHGVGIFNKIKNSLGLLDERHAVLELAKGKLTTDPASHTGEGIFFTSRMVDYFAIMSGEVYLAHTYGDDEDWVLQNREYCEGTWITMRLKNNTSRTTKEIFDKFTSGDEIGFTKTVVPVRLAQYGDEKLVSRSQAKRLLERVDRFKTVLFDFNEVESIGQAFADEVFRVYANQHPNMRIIPVNANSVVMEMINRAISGSQENQGNLFQTQS
jgi:hypothetical protein